jgi:hypothetical protein
MVGSQSALAAVDAGTEAGAIVTYSGRVAHEAGTLSPRLHPELLKLGLPVSAHNSFLVTECCNHYCLMCSQPPRDVDSACGVIETRACPTCKQVTPIHYRTMFVCTNCQMVFERD